MGEIDPVKEDESPLVEVAVEDVLEAQRVEQEIQERTKRMKNKILLDRGLAVPADPMDDMFN